MKNKLNKIIISVFTILSVFVSWVSAVEQVTVTTTSTPTNTSQIAGITINWDVIVPIIVIGVIVTIFLLIIFWIIGKIVKKIKSGKRKGYDLEYRKYQLDLKNAFLNKNSKYKHKNPLSLWLLWSKAKVYFRTSDGKKFAGYYDGELVKKEGYFILALELRYSFFKRETDLVIFPYELKNYLISYNDDNTIDLNVEGIDETLSSESFSIPVFKLTSDKYKDQIFADFSDKLSEDYFKKYVFRTVIKENMKDFANSVHEATEMNASVPYKRKTGNDLRE